MVRWWPATDVPEGTAPDLRAATHRSRRSLHALLHNPADRQAWDALAATYDEMAADWSQWADHQDHYLSPLRAGLAKARPAEWVLEVGCGTGQAAPVLGQLTGLAVSTDVNLSMVAAAARTGNQSYVVADVRQLPFATGSVPLLVGLNAVPHGGEFNRVVAASGQLLWCSSFGAGTPLYLTAQQLLTLLGAGWTAEAGHAGHGEWVLLSRL
ncbi:MAG TPA: methyltransferase domain-containing protein [Actinoplanes sp.]|nr:methyltransferase domain-containing protein [Actinoplanes sp.]